MCIQCAYDAQPRSLRAVCGTARLLRVGSRHILRTGKPWLMRRRSCLCAMLAVWQLPTQIQRKQQVKYSVPAWRAMPCCKGAPRTALREVMTSHATRAAAIFVDEDHGFISERTVLYNGCSVVNLIATRVALCPHESLWKPHINMCLSTPTLSKHMRSPPLPASHQA